MIPDYSLSEVEVFRQATLECIYETGSLSISVLSWEESSELISHPGSQIGVRREALLTRRGLRPWSFTMRVPRGTWQRRPPYDLLERKPCK
jgi:hypothetical protein